MRSSDTETVKVKGLPVLVVKAPEMTPVLAVIIKPLGRPEALKL